MATGKCKNCDKYHTEDSPCSERIAHFLNEKRKPMDTISRRDYLAGMAMNGILSSPKTINGNEDINEKMIAGFSVDIADALIARLDGEKV